MVWGMCLNRETKPKHIQSSCLVFLLCQSFMRLSLLRIWNIPALSKLSSWQLSYKTSLGQVQMNDYQVLRPLDKGQVPKSLLPGSITKEKELVLGLPGWFDKTDFTVCSLGTRAVAQPTSPELTPMENLAIEGRLNSGRKKNYSGLLKNDVMDRTVKSQEYGLFLIWFAEVVDRLVCSRRWGNKVELPCMRGRAVGRKNHR